MQVFDFSIGNGNPRNSEGAFARTQRGDIVFAYSAFRGERARDFTPADIQLVRSKDGGLTWSAPVPIVLACAYDAMNVMSVSLLPMENGDLGLIYLVRMSWTDMYIVLQRSSDGGLTWGPPVRCSTRPGYYVINNDRAVRLSSGRILIPAAEHKNKVDAEGRVIFAPASTTFFYSDDDGLSWQEAKTQLSLSCVACRSGLQEPGVVELAGGEVYGWARTDLGRQYEFVSKDQGIHWSLAVPSRFTSPLSPLSMKRLKDGRLMALWNPVPHHNLSVECKATGDRTPLVYALSQDEGITWSATVVLEDDPRAGYCYTAIFPMEDALLLAYCAGTEEDRGSCLNRLRIRRLELPLAGEADGSATHRMGIGF